MGMFSRPPTSRAADKIVPSTPTKPPGESTKYTAATETPPSTSRLGTRPPTPVPSCPPPALDGSTPVPAVPCTIKVIRPSASKQSLSARNARSHSPKPAPTFDLTDRFPPTPPLPDNWSDAHDHAICVLDTCNYSLNATIRKLRSAFPELASSPLTAVMVDKRLRMLDQNPEISYFRTGLDHVQREEQEKAARRGKAPIRDSSGPSGYDTRIPADFRASTLTAASSTIDSTISMGDRQDSGYSVESMGLVHTEPFSSGFLSRLTPPLEEKTQK